MGSLSGVLPILPTIFTPKGAIDEAGTRRVVEYIIAAGARGIVFPGLASEYETLSRDERLHMTRADRRMGRQARAVHGRRERRRNERCG